MLSRSFAASRQSFARVARQHALSTQRTFVTTALRQDLVQDMYIKELKAYKIPPSKPNESEGHVQKFSIPKAPKSPEEGDIASDLQSYQTQSVEVEGQSSGGGAATTGEDWFEDEEDYDDKPAAHH